jgi:hypothetical protein
MQRVRTFELCPYRDFPSETISVGIKDKGIEFVRNHNTTGHTTLHIIQTDNLSSDASDYNITLRLMYLKGRDVIKVSSHFVQYHTLLIL